MATMLLLPGDGIGPEVIAEVRRVAAKLTNSLKIEERDFGGTSYDKHGAPITDEAVELALKSDAVLMGAVGGPKWADVPRTKRPEAALLRLRTEMGVFANLRPAICFDVLADASSLKRELVAGLDIMIVRELTGGVYFGLPKEVTDLADGQRRAVDTQVYTTSEIERVAHVAFDLARKRRNKVTSAEKSNVMETGLLWREVVTALHKRHYADVELEHQLADNTAMQLVRRPAVRRHPDGQPVWRHPLGRSLAAHRLARPPAFRSPRRPGQAWPVRALPRVRAGYRRQGHRQPDGRDPIV